MTNEQAAILLTQVFNTWGCKISENYKDGVIMDAFKLAIDTLRTEHPKWIPYWERLPEEDVDDSYLIAWVPSNAKCDHPHYYQVADWEDGDWTNIDFGDFEEIIILAWMPLPEPYKEEP